MLNDGVKMVSLEELVNMIGSDILIKALMDLDAEFLEHFFEGTRIYDAVCKLAALATVAPK